MDREKLNEALKDEAYVRELLAMEQPEDVQASLEERGVELTLDEIERIGEALRKARSGEVGREQLQLGADGELTEDELGDVAGGGVLGDITPEQKERLREICNAAWGPGRIGEGW